MKKEKISSKIKHIITNIKFTGEIIHSTCSRITQHKKSILYHFPKKVTFAKFKKTEDGLCVYRSEYCPELNSLKLHKSLQTISYYSQLEHRGCLMITYDLKGKNYYAKKISNADSDKQVEIATGDNWHEFIYNLTGSGLFNGETCFTEEIKE